MTHPQDVPAPSPTVSEAMREAVARVIDPVAWHDFDRFGADNGRTARDRRVSLLTADRLLKSGPIASALAALERENATLRGDLKAVEDQNEALHIKLAALAPHGSCACSYDKPDDVCSHHSPVLVAAEAELATLRASAERMEAALKQVVALAPNAKPHPCDAPEDTVLWSIAEIARAALAPKETPDA